ARRSTLASRRRTVARRVVSTRMPRRIPARSPDRPSAPPEFAGALHPRHSEPRREVMNSTRRRVTRSSTAVHAAAPEAAEGKLVRLSRVRAALRRIQSGYYDRDDVRDRLVSAVLEELKRR